MARPVYSTSFFQFTVSDGVPFTETVPDGYIAVVRDIQVVFLIPAGDGAQVIVSLNGLEIVQWYLPGDYFGSDSWQGRCVAPGPTTVEAELVGGGAAEISVSGYLLTSV